MKGESAEEPEEEEVTDDYKDIEIDISEEEFAGTISADGKEAEAEEGTLGEGKEEIDISIEDEDVVEDEIESDLLDIDRGGKPSEPEKIDVEGDLEDEDIPDAEVVDEEVDKAEAKDAEEQEKELETIEKKLGLGRKRLIRRRS